LISSARSLSRASALTAASADVVQLVALTDITFTELTRIENGAGTPEDKQRAMAVLVTQLIVTGGLTALSVQGARNARALAGKPLEVVDQNGVKVLRVAGETTPEPVSSAESPASSSEHGTPTSSHPSVAHDASAEAGTKTPPHAAAEGNGPPGLSAGASEAEHWLATLERSLAPEEKAKLAKMKAGKTAQQMHDLFGGIWTARASAYAPRSASTRSVQRLLCSRRNASPICESRSRIAA
jgi:hypothetical protein